MSCILKCKDVRVRTFFEVLSCDIYTWGVAWYADGDIECTRPHCVIEIESYLIRVGKLQPTGAGHRVLNIRP